MLNAITTFTRTIRREIDVYRRVLADARTPRTAKVLLGAALAYLALPFDLIPDAIPLLGQLDDLLIVPGLVALALRFIPPDVIDDARAAVAAQRDPSV